MSKIEKKSESAVTDSHKKSITLDEFISLELKKELAACVKVMCIIEKVRQMQPITLRVGAVACVKAQA